MGIKCQTCEVLGMSTFTSVDPASFCRDVREVKRLMTDPPVVARCSTQLTFADFHTMKPFPQRSFIGEGMLRHTLVISIMSNKRW